MPGSSPKTPRSTTASNPDALHPSADSARTELRVSELIALPLVDVVSRRRREPLDSTPEQALTYRPHRTRTHEARRLLNVATPGVAKLPARKPDDHPAAFQVLTGARSSPDSARFGRPQAEPPAAQFDVKSDHRNVCHMGTSMIRLRDERMGCLGPCCILFGYD